jgi:hypothetical protein
MTNFGIIDRNVDIGSDPEGDARVSRRDLPLHVLFKRPPLVGLDFRGVETNTGKTSGSSFTSASASAQLAINVVKSAAGGDSMNSAGFIVPAGSTNTPRWKYNYDGVLQGFFCENTYSNLVLQTEDLSNAAWDVKTNVGVTLAANTSLDRKPYFGATASQPLPSKVLATAGTSVRAISQGAIALGTVTNASTTVLVKSFGNARYVTIKMSSVAAPTMGAYATFDLTTKKLIKKSGLTTGTAIAASLEKFANGYSSLYLETSFNVAVTNARLTIEFSDNPETTVAMTSNGSSDGIFVAGASVGVGIFSNTIPVNTAGTAVVVGKSYMQATSVTKGVYYNPDSVSVYFEGAVTSPVTVNEVFLWRLYFDADTYQALILKPENRLVYRIRYYNGSIGVNLDYDLGTYVIGETLKVITRSQENKQTVFLNNILAVSKTDTYSFDHARSYATLNFGTFDATTGFGNVCVSKFAILSGIENDEKLRISTKQFFTESI